MPSLHAPCQQHSAARHYYRASDASAGPGDRLCAGPVPEPPQRFALPTPFPDMVLLSPMERFCLGVSSLDAGSLPPVMRDYSTSCINYGDHLFIRNGGMYRARTSYKRAKGEDRPEELHVIFIGPCRVCGHHTRLASRHLPCYDCCRNERSF